MRHKSRLLGIAALTLLACGLPGLAGADVILIDQFREVSAFSAVGEFASPTQLINRVADQRRQQAPSSDSWSATVSTIAALGTGTSSANASQTSIVGPLLMEASGSVSIAMSASDSFVAVASAESDTYFEFILTAPYEYIWSVTVAGSGAGQGGGGARATLENFDTGTVAETRVEFADAGADTRTSMSTGTLLPGEYYWDATASMTGSANGLLEAILTSSVWNASYSVSLILIDEQPQVDPSPGAVPEASTMSLLAVGFASLLGRRRRHRAIRQTGCSKSAS